MEKIYKELINEKKMLEDIIKKRQRVKEIIEKFMEAAGNKDIERCRELADGIYIAVLRQSLEVANEINCIKDILGGVILPERERENLEYMKKRLQECYEISSKEMRFILEVQKKYNLTNAPEE